jgi:hypothetical protein
MSAKYGKSTKQPQHGNKRPQHGNKRPQHGNKRPQHGNNRKRGAIEDQSRTLEDELRLLESNGDMRFFAYNGVEALNETLCDAILEYPDQPLLQLPATLADLERLRAEKKNPSYVRRLYDQRTAAHIGQLKLLLGEVLFLTLHSRDITCVVYVGAGTGIHLPMIFDLFPHLRFILIDPAGFAKGVEERARHNPDRIQLLVRYFDCNMAQQIRDDSGERMLFISDVRTHPDMNIKTMSGMDFEQHVAHNMEEQAQWTRIIDAEVTMLKFRLPYAPGTTMYFEGDIYFQAWGPLTTTEGRIMVKRAEYDEAAYIAYDNRKYEESLHYLNSVPREWGYFDTTGKLEDMDDCFDCATEISIWRMYLNEFGDVGYDPTAMRLLLTRATGILNKTRGGHPHGMRTRDPTIRDCTNLAAFKEIDLKEYKKLRLSAMQDHTGMY